MNDDALRIYLIFVVIFFGTWGIMEISKDSDPQPVVVVTVAPTPEPTSASTADVEREPTPLEAAVSEYVDIALWVIPGLLVLGGVPGAIRAVRRVLAQPAPADPSPAKSPRDRPSQFGGNQ